MTWQERRSKLAHLLSLARRLGQSSPYGGECRDAILDILLKTLEPNPADRPSATTLLSHPIFSLLRKAGDKLEGESQTVGDGKPGPPVSRPGPPPLGIGLLLSTSLSALELRELSSCYPGSCDDSGEFQARSSSTEPQQDPEYFTSATPRSNGRAFNNCKANLELDEGTVKLACGRGSGGCGDSSI